MQTTRTFDKLVDAYAQNPYYLDCRGGTRSGKTYSILQLLVLICMSETKKSINSVVSETFPHLKRGAIRDFEDIMRREGIWEDRCWNKTDHVYTFPHNGSIIEFFSCDSASAHGPARDRLFINEGQNIAWDTVNQLFTRTRGIKIFDYNPTHPFWNEDEIAKRDHVAHISSTYLDNNFLTSQQVYEIEANKGNANWWRVYGLGLTGMLEGLIYEFTQIDKMPDPAGFKESYGMDFGFTNDPTTLIHCLTHTGRKEIYLDQRLWRVGMTNPDIAGFLKSEGIKQYSGPVVYADCAEPKSIAEIKSYGLFIQPCDKKGTIREQIQFIQPYKIYVTKTSLDLIKEFRNYTWLKTKDGVVTNEPVDFMNHGMDAFRYGVFTPFANFNSGLSAIS